MSHHLSQPGTLSERLRCKRRQKCLTQKQMATLVGTSQAVIQKIENNCSLRPRLIDKIAAVLGVRTAWLMYGEGPEQDLDAEVREVAEALSKIPEPHRSKIKAKILCYAETVSAD